MEGAAPLVHEVVDPESLLGRRPVAARSAVAVDMAVAMRMPVAVLVVMAMFVAVIVAVVFPFVLCLGLCRRNRASVLALGVEVGDEARPLLADHRVDVDDAPLASCHLAEGVQRPDDGFDVLQHVRLLEQISLVEDHDVGTLDLLDEEVDHGLHASAVPELGLGRNRGPRRVVPDERGAVHHGDHGVEAHPLDDRVALRLRVGKCLADVLGLCNAAVLEDEPVKGLPSGIHELDELLKGSKELVLHVTAGTAVGELDSVRQICGSFLLSINLAIPILPYQFGINVDTGNIVNDAPDLVFRIFQYVS
mmetsp:Transcript_4423/g.10684  ORF Transcript_4423/g.10684 Transcript_4423/m.10684 type:complete len:306 (-) Transcript_4423:189-1106(-)